jgi:hypothetical protein
MVNSHHNQGTFTIRGELLRLISIVAKRGDLSRPMPQAGDGFDGWHNGTFSSKFVKTN